jgi:hypothetical protein
VEGVLAIPLAVFHELKLLLHGLAVFAGGVIPALAFRALQGDDFYRLFLRSHRLSPFRGKTFHQPRQNM